VTLTRINPEIGYIDVGTARDLGLSHLIRAGDWLYLSGVAPVSTENGSLELLSPGDYRAQLTSVLEIIEKTLKVEGACLADVVSTTIYARNVSDYVANVDVIKSAFGDSLPTSTLVGVSALFFEEQQVEVVAVAYRPV
jgi:2-iminobutanoate/2-iminopropanoate deaminase